MESANIESNPSNIDVSRSIEIAEQKINQVEFPGQNMQKPLKNLTLADLLEIKKHTNNGINLSRVPTKKDEKALSNLLVKGPNLSKSARKKRNKRLRELGLWSLWNNLHQSNGYLDANGAPVDEKQLTRGAKRRLKKMREQGFKHVQIHKVAVGRHLKNSWSEVAVHTRYEEISTFGSSPHVEGVQPMETGAFQHPPTPETTPPVQSQMQSPHCENNASGIGNVVEDTAYYLPVTIIPEGYPNVMLNQEQAGMIKDALLAKIDMLPPGTVGPKFSDFNLTEGAIVVSCLDNHTQRWLEEVITVCTPRRGIKLMISRQVTAVTWIPGPCEDPEVILRRMRVQNDNLSTGCWKILQRGMNDMGQELVVSMEDSEWRKIEEIGFMPYVNFSRVLFTALQ